MNEYNTFRLIFVLLLLFGCNAPDPKVCTNYPDNDLTNQQTKFPITLSLQDDFSQQEIEIVLAAMDEWNTAVGSEIFIFGPKISPMPSVPKCGFVYVYKIEYDPEKRILGHTSWSSCDAFIEVVVKSAALKEVMEHELGHVLNLYHDKDNRWSIMSPSIAIGQTIQPHHIEHVHEIMNCWSE